MASFSIKLYGEVDSPSTIRALASLFEHELKFAFVAVNLNDVENYKQDPFLSSIPFRQFPVLQDGDLTIFGCRAIMRFISHQYFKLGKEQIYMVPKMQGIAALWIDVEAHQFHPPATKLITELVFHPKNGLPTDEGLVEIENARLAAVLDVYEERLASSEFLGGDKFTSGDLTHVPSLYYLFKTPVKHLFVDRPNVKAWCDAIMSRSSWTRVAEMVEEGGWKV